MTSMGIHLTDTFIQMLGTITQVHALTTKGVTAWESGDLVSAHMTFENGATGSFSSLLYSADAESVHDNSNRGSMAPINHDPSPMPCPRLMPSTPLNTPHTTAL